MAESATYVYDAEDRVLGRIASHVAKQLLAASKAGREERVIIINAEQAVVTGKRSQIFTEYRAKYELNHARKGPFFPRMPDQILKRAVRGMLPYQRNSSGRNAIKSLRVEIGTPSDLEGKDLPEGCEWGDATNFSKPLPQSYVRLGAISQELGIDISRWGGE